jgi:PIN domain nuclease of toxin-antitoxin system
MVQKPDLLGAEVGALLATYEDALGLSAISPWEVARKAKIARVRPDAESALWLNMPYREWIRHALPSSILVLPLTPEIAGDANDLPRRFHDDPMDQIIVATARWHHLTIITCDRAIRDYREVRSLWYPPPPKAQKPKAAPAHLPLP